MSRKLHITEVGRVAVPASDQDRALEFYVGTLGFELRSDVTFADGRAGATPCRRCSDSVTRAGIR